MSNEWPIVEFGEFTELVKRPTEASGIVGSVGVKWYGEGVHIVEEKPLIEFQAERFDIHKDDLIYNDMWARKGSVAIVPEKYDRYVASAHFPTWELDRTRVYPRFLAWYFRTSQFWRMCENSSQGSTGRNAISKAGFRKLTIPLPCLDEQRRIVARIEELAARVEQAQGLRRQAVTEVERLLSSAKGRIFSDTFCKKWPAMTIQDIADIGSGVTLGRQLSEPVIRVPYLRVANVQDGYLDLKKVKTVEIRVDEFEKWRLMPGDILLTEGGDWDKLGRGTVWQGEIKNCIHQNHIFRVRVNPSEFEPRYLSALISSPYGKAYFRNSSKQTTNLASINKRQLRAFVIFKPPLPEQRRIVAYLDDLQAKVEAVKQHQADTAARLDALMPSILDRAFRGEL